MILRALTCCLISFQIQGNQKELVQDLMMKAKQIEYLINSLPEPEPEEAQVSRSQHVQGPCRS